MAEILGCRDARHSQISRHAFDLGVGIPEKIVQQILTVEFGEFLSEGMFRSQRVLFSTLPKRAGLRQTGRPKQTPLFPKSGK